MYGELQSTKHGAKGSFSVSAGSRFMIVLYCPWLLNVKEAKAACAIGSAQEGATSMLQAGTILWRLWPHLFAVNRKRRSQTSQWNCFGWGTVQQGHDFERGRDFGTHHSASGIGEGSFSSHLCLSILRCAPACYVLQLDSKSFHLWYQVYLAFSGMIRGAIWFCLGHSLSCRSWKRSWANPTSRLEWCQHLLASLWP